MISSKKAETIQGFLSPTKLLSGGSKLRQTGRQQNGKSPLNTSYKKAVSSPNGNDQSQNQSYLNTSRQLEREESPPRYNDGNFSRLTGGENVGYEGRNQRKYESERNIGWESKAERKPIGVAREIIEEDEGYGRQRTLEEINNRRWQTHNPNTQFNAINLRQSPSGNARMLQTNPTASFKPTTFSSKPSLSQQSPLQTSSMLKSSNPEVMTIQCYELLRKLSKIKETLQLQILQLQTLLDNTSKYMDNMEGEFERIKDSILSYTASCLDNAFAEYKKNMVEWSKYEDFERKSLTMLSQINDYIYNQQQKLSSPKKPSYRQMTSSAQQFQRQIQFYGQFSQEIKKIRQQCIGMRPTLTAERIRQYEKGLAVLCNF